MEAWKHATKSLTKIKNETIKELVTTGLTKYILPKLENNPPDVETLRQFVFFPLFGEFENESLCMVSNLHNYFNIHVCLSLRRPSVRRPSVRRPASRPTFEFPIPAGV